MRNSPTVWFWNFAGFALIPLSIGLCWSLIRATNYKLEAAHHKLEVNTAARQVKKVTYGLGEDVQHLPIAQPKKQNYQQQLEQAEEQLTQTQEEILTEDEK